MTCVTIYRNEDQRITGFTAIDHAGYAEEGQDIVCAALSILMINTINSIDTFTSDEATLVTNPEEGLIDFRLKEEPSEQAELLFSAMVLGLQSIAENEEYRDYFKMIFEEV